MQSIQPLSPLGPARVIDTLDKIKSTTIVVTDSYTVAADDTLKIKGTLGFKLDPPAGATVDLTIDGSVLMDNTKHAGLIGVASTKAPNGEAHVTLAEGALLSIKNSSGGLKGAAGVVLQTGVAEVVNAGDIHVFSVGLSAGSTGVALQYGHDASLDNSGDIHATGFAAVGGYVQSTGRAALLNSGTIEVEADVQGEGAHVWGSAGSLFQNDGDITVSSGIVVYGAHIDGAVDIANTGDISAVCLSTGADTSSPYQAIALWVTYDSTAAAMENSGRLHADGGSHLAIGASIRRGGEFHNSGHIDATSTGAAQVVNFASAGVMMGMPDNGVFTNDGTVSGEYSVISYDVGYGGGPASEETVVNNGTLTGKVSLGDGADSFDSHAGILHGAVWGCGGSDTLIGSKGGDVLNGGDETTLGGADAADSITGGGGADTLSGGDGADVFIYAKTTDSTSAHADVVTDLQSGDVIDLSQIDANTAQKNDQAFHLVASFGGHAGELVVSYNAGSGLTTISGDVDGDGTADLVITASGDHHDFTSFVL